MYKSLLGHLFIRDKITVVIIRITTVISVHQTPSACLGHMRL